MRLPMPPSWLEVPLLIFNIRLCVFLLLNYKSYLYILDMSLIRYIVCKIFFPFSGLSFHFLDDVF